MHIPQRNVRAPFRHGISNLIIILWSRVRARRNGGNAQLKRQTNTHTHGGWVEQYILKKQTEKKHALEGRALSNLDKCTRISDTFIGWSDHN